MRVFRFELRAQLRGFLAWAVGLLTVFVLFVVFFFESFMQSRAAVERALLNLPPAFAAVFGVDAAAMFSFGGFFSFVYTYIGLIGAIMAASIGVAVFSREKRAKCVDFLFVKPIGRGRVFAEKLLACLLLIGVVNALFVACAAASYAWNGQDPTGAGKARLASLSLLFLQLGFLAVGALYAVLARKVRSVSGTATAIGFAGFIVMALHSLTGEEALRYVSALEYFSPDDVFAGGGFEPRYAIAAAVVCAACFMLAYCRYRRSDTRAV